jgi:hypothetical protein
VHDRKPAGSQGPAGFVVNRILLFLERAFSLSARAILGAQSAIVISALQSHI